jgi:hypothetical protein
MATVEPFYQASHSCNRHRLAEIDAEIQGGSFAPADPQWEMIQSLNRAATRDPDCLRGVMSISQALRTPGEVLAQPGLPERRWRPARTGGRFRAAGGRGRSFQYLGLPRLRKPGHGRERAGKGHGLTPGSGLPAPASGTRYAAGPA